MRSLGDALKETRRRTYQHEANWRVLVVSKTLAMQAVAYDEILRTIEASSLPVESTQRSTKPNETFIQMGKGGMIKFAVIKDSLDAYLHAGQVYRHIIWLYEATDKVSGYVNGLARTNGQIPDDHIVTERVDW